jgi:hypothetical protein
LRAISLEPRTPHQPEKLGNVSKNECVFTPSIFIVNENYVDLSPVKSIECSPFTRRCQVLVQSLMGFGRAGSINARQCGASKITRRLAG